MHRSNFISLCIIFLQTSLLVGCSALKTAGEVCCTTHFMSVFECTNAAVDWDQTFKVLYHRPHDGTAGIKLPISVCCAGVEEVLRFLNEIK